MTSNLRDNIKEFLSIPVHVDSFAELFGSYSKLLVTLNSQGKKIDFASVADYEDLKITGCRKKVLELETLFEHQLSDNWHDLLDYEGEKNTLQQVSRFFGRIYSRMVIGELSNLQITQGRFCQVGIGAMPLSLLLYLQKTSFYITGIDVDASALRKASFGIKTVLGKIQIPTQRVDFRLVDGADYDYADYDVVVVSMTVTDRERVLQRIIDTSTRPNVRVVLRDTEGWGQFLYSPVGPPSQIEYKKIDAHAGFPISSTIYSIEQ